MRASNRDEVSIEAPSRPTQPVSSLSALAFPDFRMFWFHAASQGIGRNMRDMLTFLAVYQISGSAVQLGLTGLFQAGPAIIFGLIGGALADTVDRKKLLVYTQSANVVSSVLVAVLVLMSWAEVWHLWLFVSFWTAVNIFTRPAQRAYIPKLVPSTHIVNAITWFGGLSQGTLFIGPLIAGFAAAAFGIGWAYMLNTVLMIVALVAIWFIRASGAPEGEARKVSAKLILEGISFVRMKEVLLAAFVLDFGVMSVGFVRPLLPILALDIYDVGETGLGIMNAATAVGAVTGTFVLLKMGNIERKGAVIVAAYAIYSVALAGLGLAPWFALALLALGLMGMMDVLAFTLKQSLIQIVAPDEYRGRSVSLSSIMSVLGNATGAVEMGAMTAAVGAPTALVINSAIALGVTGIVGSVWRGLPRYRDAG